MMTRAEIRCQLIDLVQPLDAIADDTPLAEAMYDSFRYVEVALGIEDRLGVRLTDADLTGITRFGELVDLVHRRQEESHGVLARGRGLLGGW